MQDGAGGREHGKKQEDAATWLGWLMQHNRET